MSEVTKETWYEASPKAGGGFSWEDVSGKFRRVEALGAAFDALRAETIRCNRSEEHAEELTKKLREGHRRSETVVPLLLRAEEKLRSDESSSREEALALVVSALGQWPTEFVDQRRMTKTMAVAQ